MKVTNYAIEYNGITYFYKNKSNYNHDLKTVFKNDDIKTWSFETHIIPLIEISLLNKKGQEFSKGFDSLKEAKLFLNKQKRGNSLTVTSIISYSSSVLEELSYVYNH